MLPCQRKADVGDAIRGPDNNRISHLQRAEIRGEYLLTTHCGNFKHYPFAVLVHRRKGRETRRPYRCVTFWLEQQNGAELAGHSAGLYAGTTHNMLIFKFGTLGKNV
jgi:hypothetical protein